MVFFLYFDLEKKYLFLNLFLIYSGYAPEQLAAAYSGLRPTQELMHSEQNLYPELNPEHNPEQDLEDTYPQTAGVEMIPFTDSQVFKILFNYT